MLRNPKKDNSISFFRAKTVLVSALRILFQKRSDDGAVPFPVSFIPKYQNSMDGNLQPSSFIV
ncbi:hypothetical protein EFP84_00170 [Leptospira kmetyi]|uniref:Uncharacterized protein n=1 Tax=Leptospira kmetyi TaxID=408139 RepID=A0AAD0UMA2_9LEPT|nr:hypothetical protein EFP84_00170 [Leptospira kmetyi]